MRYYLDTEFIERPGFLQLISIGIVAQDGREFYAVSNEWQRKDCNDWVADNVLPYLGIDFSRWESHDTIAQLILSFIGDDANPEFWAYYADYDWVVFCWLFGTMLDLPKHFPMYCNDLKQEMERLGISRENLPLNDEVHNALADARWVKVSHKLINNGEV